MKAPLSWIKDYVDIDVSVEELKNKLFSCGFEVEEVIEVAKEITGVVVAKILQTEPHPNADKLTVCQVDVGKDAPLQIITGAKNVSVGDLVPVALDGATLAGGKTIQNGELRGLPSYGMMCSGEELGINDDVYEGADVNGILIIKEAVQCGTDIRDALGMRDVVFDIGVTANRPDCQSIYGIAREVAAILKKPLKPLQTDYTADSNLSTRQRVGVEVKDGVLCPRYMAHYVSDLKVEKSPAWMRKRLASMGLRSINNVVDITNFVLLEVGQPMHAFDLNRLSGSQIVVRRAEDGETIVTLDEKKFDLKPEHLVICDGDKPAALAGIMGGAESGISEQTTELLFESAKFARDNIRKTSRALGQRSDSSSRFEKGVDAYTNEIALNRALHLIEELACGKIACDRYDVLSESLAPRKIVTTLDRINALLGIEVPAAEAVAILERLEFEVRLSEGDLEVTVPLYREDVEGYPDLAEEIIRTYGYDHITPTLMTAARITNGGKNPAQRDEDKLKDVMCGMGLDEIISYSFVSEKQFDTYGLDKTSAEHRFTRLINPLGEDLSVMRTTLLPSMVAVLARNLNRKAKSVALYEFANTYHPYTDDVEVLPNEEKRLSIGMYGENGGFFDMKGVVEGVADAFCLRFEYVRGSQGYMHPTRSATVLCDGEVVGYFGELHPEIAQKEGIDKVVTVGELYYDKLRAKFGAKFVYRNIPKYPSVERDLALVADLSMTSKQIADCILSSGGHYLTGVSLFDVYTGDKVATGKKSMAYSLTFVATDRTLSVEEVDGYIADILSALQKMNVVIR